MSPRIIHIPLSGGDHKAQAKGIRCALGIHASHYRESVLIRSAAEAKIREADRLECEAWNAIMWAGGPAMPSPGDPQAEPTIAKAINGGFDLLEAECNRCDRVSLVPLGALRQPGGNRQGRRLNVLLTMPLQSALRRDGTGVEPAVARISRRRNARRLVLRMP